MIPIILYGNNEDLSVNITIQRVISSCKEEDIIKKCMILDYHSCDMDMFKSNKGIFVFKNAVEIKENIKIPDNFTAILPAYNSNAAAILQKINVFAITCGTSPRDTVSMSSFENLKSVVSLQRSIKNINGNIVEPHEFIVNLKRKTGLYPLLAASTVLLLCSNADSNNIYCF